VIETISLNSFHGLFFGVDLATFLQAIGLLGIFAIVFAESGLLMGFFCLAIRSCLPQDFLPQKTFFP